MRNVKNLSLCVLLLALVSTAAGATLYVNTDGSGGAYTSIQAAINDADPDDEIEVAAGTYNEAINFSGKAIRLYSSSGPDVTTIDGTGHYHVVQCISGEGSATVLEGFTITGGNANGSEPDNLGGGMYNTGSSPTVTNCIFTSNIAYRGGGMLNLASSSPTVTKCTFSGNNARDGGGMYNDNTSRPTVTNCTFSNNAAYLGGGMYNSYTKPTVTNCRFVSNTASLHGGGMHNEHSYPTVTNCSFIGNTAAAHGGGIMNNYGKGDFGGVFFIVNCSFVQNSVGGWGGGCCNANTAPCFVNCTFSGNTASDGGGTYNSASSIMTAINCIYWGDTVNEIVNNSSITTVTYSDVEGGWVGTGNIEADPLFADADGRLLAASLCIDAGDNSAVPSGVTTDLDGNPRIQGLCVDMGAFEAGPETMLVPLRSYILQQVGSGNIDVDLEGSLLDKVDAASETLASGNPNSAKPAMKNMEALINQVKAQTDKKIEADAAAAIIVRANAIIAALGD